MLGLADAVADFTADELAIVDDAVARAVQLVQLTRSAQSAAHVHNVAHPSGAVECGQPTT